MRYLDSYRFVFKNPNWFVNSLLLAVCIVIPAVGPIVLMGYMFDVFDALRERRGEDGYPSFEFNRFVPYLSRGAWVFLVQLVLQLIVSIPMMGLSLMLMILGAAMAKSTGGATVVLAWLVVMILSLVTGVLSSLLLWPPMIHAGLKRTIDFKPMVAFTKDFLRRNWKETLLAQLFLVLSGMIVTTLGMLALCVGIYIATAIVMLAQHHLMHQVYELHLQRGGISVEEKPSLNVELVTPDGPSGELDDMA